MNLAGWNLVKIVLCLDCVNWGVVDRNGLVVGVAEGRSPQGDVGRAT